MTDARAAPAGRSNPALHAAAACAPAILWTAVGCPFDVIKTRLQTAAVPFASPLQCLVSIRSMCTVRAARCCAACWPSRGDWEGAPR